MLPPQRPSPMRQRRKLLTMGLIGGLAFGASVAGCRGLDEAYDCDIQRVAFYEAAVDESFLRGWIDEESPYHVVITFSEQGINDMLAAVLGSNIPFAGDLATGTLNVSFEPEGVPTIEVIATEGCDSCIVYGLEFAVDGLSGGGSVASGVGAVKLQIPVELDKRSATQVVLVARYDKAEIIDMDLAIFGFDSDEHLALAGALEIVMTEEIQATYGAEDLMEFGSWDLGEGEVELLARELKAFPEQGTLSIGLNSNLELGEGVGIELDGSLKGGVGMGFSLATGLFGAMGQRMLAEGRIPRLYNEDGNPDPNGNYGATLVGIAGEDDDLARLNTTFRIWRIDYGYCGYAEIVMPMDLQIEDLSESPDQPWHEVRANPGSITVATGKGIGSVAAEDDQLVQDQEQLVDIFKQELAETLEETLNYGGVDLSESDVWVVPQTVAVDVSSVTLTADFIVLAGE